MRYIPNSSVALLCILAWHSSAHTVAGPVEIDASRSELRIPAVVQKNPKRPAHSKWGKKSTAFFGVRGGSETKDFIFVADADRAEIYRVAKTDLGWNTGNVLAWHQTLTRRGLSTGTKMGDFLTGDPVLVSVEFERDGQKVTVPLQDVIRSRVRVKKKWVEVPYTPHFVFTGAGEENDIQSGCVVCPSDCVGALITDNSMPVQTESEQYLVDWSKLPAPGKTVTIVLRSFR